MRWAGLIFWVGLCFVVAGVSSRWTAGAIPGWYRTLERPSIAPPNWVFAPVWTLLYVLMAVAAWRIWLTDASPMRSAALALFLFQLGLNFAWSLLFFRLHLIGWALAEVLLLWAAIGTTALAFYLVSPLSGWLMVPYWAWVSFAAVLNAAFWRLNRGL
jgi:tryptophan-rich sensory protein